MAMQASDDALTLALLQLEVVPSSCEVGVTQIQDTGDESKTNDLSNFKVDEIDLMLDETKLITPPRQRCRCSQSQQCFHTCYSGNLIENNLNPAPADDQKVPYSPPINSCHPPKFFTKGGVGFKNRFKPKAKTIVYVEPTPEHIHDLLTKPIIQFTDEDENMQQDG